MPKVFTSPNGTHYEVTGPLNYEGDTCDFFSCVYEPKEDPKPGIKSVWDRLREENVGTRSGILKITRETWDRDLTENEGKMLSELYPSAQAEEKFFRYLPHLLDSFEVRDGAETRWANVFPQYQALTSLGAIHRFYPSGIDYRDLAWMIRRTLECLFFVHTRGVVHGAVLPNHILVDGIGHGARLISWSYSTPRGGQVQAFSSEAIAFYAPEILQKLEVTPATDLYMLGKVMISLLGGNVREEVFPDSVPPELQGLIKRILIKAPARRIQSASEFYDELDAILVKLVGKRSYRAFSVEGPVDP